MSDTSRNARRALLLFLLSMAFLCTGCWQRYTGDEIAATVVDAATNLPLAGVNVVAWCPALGPGFIHPGTPIENLSLRETVTNEQGKFAFPKWGKIWSRGSVRGSSPSLFFFKSGYEPYQTSNGAKAPPDDYWSGGPIRSDWNGKTIPLKASAAPAPKQAERLYFFGASLGSLVRDDMRCDWPRIIRMIEALELESRRIGGRQSYGGRGLYSQLLDNDKLYQRDCGASPKALLNLG